MFSLTNSITIYSVVPIFDNLTDITKSSVFTITDEERKILTKEKQSFIEKAKSLQTSLKIKINSYISTKSKKEILLTLSLTIIPLIIIRGLLDFIARFIFSYAGNKAVFNIRNNIFSHLIRLPFPFFFKSRSGEMMSRITADVIPLTSALSTDIYNFFSGIILLVTNLIILSIINWKMVIIIIIAIPLISFPISFMGNLVKKYTKKIQESFADVSSHLQESFSGIKIIKSFTSESYEYSRFQIINNLIFSRELKKRIYQNLNPAIVELLGSIAATILFIYGGYEIINGNITSGEFIFFILIILNLFEPVKNISEAINGTKAGEAASKRILKILDYPKEILEEGMDASFNHTIEFKNVSFKYLNNNILNNINIAIPKGKKVGIVGSSGSGKTTLLNMIASFYSPTEGSILFDGLDIKKISLNWIRGNIALVTQDVFLFHGTILDNITCGKNIAMEKIIHAAKIANAHEFISMLPQNYNTIVGERGALLSGGERQRISIARAIAADPEIILFDEATSALDPESEKYVRDSLDFLFAKTAVIVSHRLSTIQHADIIYVLENGVIKQSGTHNELYEKSERYRRLFNL
ncbi:MAG: ABC transporter ATP-binding protein [Spirochaetota bacterium]